MNEQHKASYIEKPEIGQEVRVRGRRGTFKVTEVVPQAPMYKCRPASPDAEDGGTFQGWDLTPLKEPPVIGPEAAPSSVDLGLYNRRT